MPFSRPSLEQIRSQIRNDYEERLNLPPLPERSTLGVMADSNGGGIHLLYGYLDYISKQAFPDSAEGIFLSRWASIWGIASVEAAFTTGSVTFTGVNGASIPINTFLTSNSNEFRTINRTD